MGIMWRTSVNGCGINQEQLPVLVLLGGEGIMVMVDKFIDGNVRKILFRWESMGE